MSKLKNDLLARKKQIEQQLKPYEELLKELDDVNRAIAALVLSARPNCGSSCPGCSECRGGPNYR